MWNIPTVAYALQAVETPYIVLSIGIASNLKTISAGAQKHPYYRLPTLGPCLYRSFSMTLSMSSLLGDWNLAPRSTIEASKNLLQWELNGDFLVKGLL